MFIHPVYASLHLPVLNSQSFPSPHPFPLGNHNLFSMYVSLFLFQRCIHLHCILYSTYLLLFSYSSVRLFVTPWTAARRASLSITNSRSLLKLMFIESVMRPTISSSVIPFSSCLQSFPVSGSFPVSSFFASGGQSIGASASVLPMNIQD